MTLTVAEMAQLRGCSERYIQKLIQDNIIPAQAQSSIARGGRNGVSWKIPLAQLPDKDIKKWLRQNRKKAAVQPSEPESVTQLDVEKLTEEERQEVNLKNRIIDGWLAYRFEAGLPLAEADRQYIRIIGLQYPELHLGLSTLKRWEKNRREKGEMGIIDRRGQHGNHHKAISDEVWGIFKQYYLEPNRRSVALCIRLTGWFLEKHGRADLLPLPDERTFARWIERNITIPELKYERFGEKAFRDGCVSSIHRDYEGLQSNDIWVCDNHTFDVMVTDGEKPMRVHLTAFMDVRSRKMMGWYVTQNPCSDATLYALRRGIEAYGIPKRILSDNGREFVTHDIGGRGFRKSSNTEKDPATILERLGIEFKTAMVCNARAKIIERAFLTLKEQFSVLEKAYTGGNTIERPERLKRLVRNQKELYCIEELTGQVDLWIRGIYNKTESDAHGMLGRTPDEVYAAELVDQRLAAPGELNLMLLRASRMQTVQKDGVYLEFYGKKLWFVSVELLQYHQREKVYVRYNPEDLNQVRVYDSEDRFMMVCEQDRALSYFASKEEVKEKMAEQRRLEKVLKGYHHLQEVEVEDALSLMMWKAEQNLKEGDAQLDPKIIRLHRAPDSESAGDEDKKAAAGGDMAIDYDMWNERLRQQKLKEGKET